MQRKAGHVEYLRGVGTEQQSCAGFVQCINCHATNFDGACRDFGIESAFIELTLLRRDPSPYCRTQHVLHLGLVAEFIGRYPGNTMFEHRFRRNIPGTSPRRFGRDSGYLVSDRLIGQQYIEKSAVAARCIVVRRKQRCQVAVEMVDCRHAGAQGTADTDRNRHVPGERHAEFVRYLGNGEKLIRTQAGMQLDKVIAGGVLRPDFAPCIGSACDGIAVERRSRHNQPWPEHLGLENLLPQA